MQPLLCRVQTQLADFWFFEHLLSLPKSVVDDEMVYHLGSMFPYREVESASLPAPVSARLFLRRMRNQPQPIADWDEQFQMLGLMCQLSCKREQFRSREMAAAINPPSELIIEVSSSHAPLAPCSQGPTYCGLCVSCACAGAHQATLVNHSSC